MGTEGNMDQKWYFSPNEVNYKKLYDVYKKSMHPSMEPGKTGMDDYHAWLRKESHHLAIVVKIPQYGAGRIKTFLYNDYKDVCGDNDQIKIYVNELYANGTMSATDANNATNCVFSGLKENTKYVVSYV